MRTGAVGKIGNTFTAMGPEAIVGAIFQYATLFMIVGLVMGGAVRRGRLLAGAVLAVAVVLGAIVAVHAPVAAAGLIAGIVALAIMGSFAAVGRLLRRRFDAPDKGKTSQSERMV